MAAYEQAAAQYRSTVLQAFQDIVDVLRALEFYADALKAQDVAERTAADSLDLSRKQFQAGAISICRCSTRSAATRRRASPW